MKNSIVLCVIFILFLSCNTPAITIKNGQVVSFKRLVPNGIFINDTLMCDEGELTVLDYREYMFWIGRTYGLNSYTYKNTLPDTMVGYNFFKKYKAEGDSTTYDVVGISETYFNTPVYNDFPIVGITYEQAVNYSNWRSDMVLQMMLFNSQLIKLHPEGDSLSCFTASRYLSGEYYNYKPPKNLMIPKFRLPTIEEWELCAQHGNSTDWGVDSTSKAFRKYRKHSDNLFLTKDVFLLVQQKKLQLESPNYKNRIPYCGHTRSFFKDANQPYHLIGNVAEMTLVKGVAKGGSWFHTLAESTIKSKIPYQEQEAWLGCRNVCTWVKVN
jgi:Sulfatase-modifying factor enzyme 1